jgi:hypothetical protein
MNTPVTDYFGNLGHGFWTFFFQLPASAEALPVVQQFVSVAVLLILLLVKIWFLTPVLPKTWIWILYFLFATLKSFGTSQKLALFLHHKSEVGGEIIGLKRDKWPAKKIFVKYTLSNLNWSTLDMKWQSCNSSGVGGTHARDTDLHRCP